MKLTLFLILISLSVFGQKYKPFIGKLVYEVEMTDTSLQSFFPRREMVIYTNDTIVRIENETVQFGKQVVIKHTVLNKSYLLLNDGMNKFAIQTNLNDKDDSDTNRFELIYKKKCGKELIVNIKSNKLLITTEENGNPIEVNYFKNLSPKYIDAFNKSPGLPVKYTLNTKDGEIQYQLVEMEEYLPEHDLFGISSDFTKVSFDEFIQIMYKNKNIESSPK